MAQREGGRAAKKNLRKGLAVLFACILCVLGAKCFYQFAVVPMRGSYGGTIVVPKKGSPGIYGVINPNQVGEYAFLNLTPLMRKIGVESISLPVVDDGAMYVVCYDGRMQNPYCVVKVKDGVVYKASLPLSVNYGVAMKIVCTPDFLAIRIGDKLYFAAKDDLTVQDARRLCPGSDIMPYKNGVLSADKETGASAYYDGRTKKFLFALASGWAIDNWYSADKIKIDMPEGDSALVNLEGREICRCDGGFSNILGNEPNKMAVLAVAEPDPYGALNFNFHIMDILRTDAPLFGRPYIYDTDNGNVVALPDWAGYGIWLDQDFSQSDVMKLQEEIDALT